MGIALLNPPAGKTQNKKAFKKYVMRTKQNGFVFLTEIELAPIEEYYIDGPTPTEVVKNSMSTKQLRKLIKSNKDLATVLTSQAKRYNAATRRQILQFKIRMFVWDTFGRVMKKIETLIQGLLK